jgi:hypothetical protein
LDSHDIVSDGFYGHRTRLLDIGRFESRISCPRQGVVVQEPNNALPATTRCQSDNIFNCKRCSVCRSGFARPSREPNLRLRPGNTVGMYVERDEIKNLGGGEMTRQEQIRAAWMLLQEVQLDPRSYTARGRQQVRETARISCSLPADVVRRLDSLGNARSHHVEKALKLYLLLIEDKGLSVEESSKTRKNDSLL